MFGLDLNIICFIFLFIPKKHRPLDYCIGFCFCFHRIIVAMGLVYARVSYGGCRHVSRTSKQLECYVCLNFKYKYLFTILQVLIYLFKYRYLFTKCLYSKVKYRYLFIHPAITHVLYIIQYSCIHIILFDLLFSISVSYIYNSTSPSACMYIYIVM